MELKILLKFYLIGFVCQLNLFPNNYNPINDNIYIISTNKSNKKIKFCDVLFSILIIICIYFKDLKTKQINIYNLIVYLP